ncbi:MAG: hypothetical protein HY720_16565 [Planctomycetes bacterium]|nr:hypothetical protein [Planctomycetota bacterium]
MNRLFVALFVLAALALPALAQEGAGTLRVTVELEEKTAAGATPFSYRVRLQARAGQETVLARGWRVPVAAGGGTEYHDAGMKVWFTGQPEGEGVTYELGVEVSRQHEGARGIVTTEVHMSGRVPGGDLTEVARLEASDPETSTWVVRLGCEGDISPAPSGGVPIPDEENRWEYKLQGILSEGGPQRALLTHGIRVLEVEEGDLLPGDWQVADIAEGQVVLVGPGGVQRVLSLEK